MLSGTLITLASIHAKDERTTITMMTNLTSSGIADSASNGSAISVTLLPTTRPNAPERGLILKSREQRGKIDARRLVGIVLLFTGTTLICIGSTPLHFLLQSEWTIMLLICFNEATLSPRSTFVCPQSPWRLLNWGLNCKEDLNVWALQVWTVIRVHPGTLRTLSISYWNERSLKVQHVFPFKKFNVRAQSLVSPSSAACGVLLFLSNSQ